MDSLPKWAVWKGQEHPQSFSSYTATKNIHDIKNLWRFLKIWPALNIPVHTELCKQYDNRHYNQYTQYTQDKLVILLSCLYWLYCLYTGCMVYSVILFAQIFNNTQTVKILRLIFTCFILLYTVLLFYWLYWLYFCTFFSHCTLFYLYLYITHSELSKATSIP